MSDESDFAEAWRPAPGDTITGRMIGVELIDPNGQGAYPCVTIQRADGEARNVHAFHTVLQKELARRRPKIGDELTISYLGKKGSSTGREYHAYKVLGGQAPEMNWDAFLPPEERQVSAAPPIAAAQPFASVSGAAVSSAPAAAEDFSPLPPKPPAPKGEQFGDEPPF